MFEKFTEKAINVVSKSQQIAKDMGATEVRAEHLLLALYDEAKGISLKIFKSYNISYEELYEEVKKNSHGVIMQKKLTLCRLMMNTRKF